MDHHQSTQVERPYCVVTLKNDNAPELYWSFYPRHGALSLRGNPRQHKVWPFLFLILIWFLNSLSYYYISCYLQFSYRKFQWPSNGAPSAGEIPWFYLRVIGRLAPSVTSFQSLLSCRSCFVWQLANKNINTDSYLTGRWQWCYTDIDWICSIWFTYMLVHYVNVYMICYKCKWI